jgi:transposase
MAQLQLPLFPAGSTEVTQDLAFEKKDGQVTYFYGSLPVFSHTENDIASFKMITAQFYLNGYVKQMDIVRAFGVSAISVKRAVKRFQEEGPQGFYTERNTRGATVLTAEVLKQAQQYLNDGLEACEVADRLAIKPDTLSKAIRAKRLHKMVKKNSRQ